MAQKNLLLHLGKDSFGAQDGDGIQLENRSDGSFEYGKIILDGTEPLGIVNFLVQETNGDNLIAEDSLQRTNQVNLIAEDSIFSFGGVILLTIASKISSIPIPFFALASIISSLSQPINSII